MATLKWTGGFNDDYSVAANWVNVATGAASVPTTSDTIVFADSSEPVRSGLDQSGVTLTAVRIEQSYTGTIGTDSSYLQLRATTFDIGLGSGSGSPRIKLDTGSAGAATVRVHDTGTSVDGLPALMLNIGNSGTSVYVNDGDVGIAVAYPGETSTINLLSVGGQFSGLSPSVIVSSGTTVSTYNVLSGTLYNYGGGGSNYTSYGGTTIINTGDALNSLIVYAGIVYADRHGTIGTVTMYGGTTDTTRTAHPRTWTGATIYAGATLKYSAYVTITNDLAPSGKLQLTIAEL